MPWSAYQEAVFDFITNGEGNGLVEAMPGSGKTTVIEECVKRVPSNESILLLAFNRHIRDELKDRMAHLPNVTVHTINSFGNGVVKAAVGYRKVNGKKVENILKFDYFEMKKYDKKKFVVFIRCVNFVTRMISLFKANMVFDLEHADSIYQSLIDDYGLEEPDLEGTRYDLYHMVMTVFDFDLKTEGVIDFDDQVYLPVKNDYPVEQFDHVYVDEAQDLSPVQIEFTRRAIASRSLYVGDRRQAIYQFRGADSRAMENIQLTLSSTLMPLSICYRCAKAIVREAAKIVPAIEAFEGSPEGKVENIIEDEFRTMAQDDDVVLCRTTAPLVKECFGFIRNGQCAHVKGRDIGNDLKNFIKKLSGGNNFMPIDQFAIQLGDYGSKMLEKYRLLGRDTSMMILEDKIGTVRALIDHSEEVDDLYKAIDKIFGNGEEDGIMLMTIHKAKGLEAERVFILRPDQLPHKLAKTEEARHAEENLKFVAITRAQRELYWVHQPPDN